MQSRELLEEFLAFKTVFDQLPQIGAYAVHLKDGVHVIMPFQSFDTVDEAKAAPDREGHVKVVLNGTKPYRLWWLTERDLVLVGEYATDAELKLKQTTSPCTFLPTGPGQHCVC